ncbi:MAG: AMP-binding protein, partial [Acidobacteria bacterium]|nr:AMP-binding protein [Acidobacteriota bacterium]
KEQLRAVPNRGLGFGWLRDYGSEEARQKLAALPAAQVLFNNLGLAEAGGGGQEGENPLVATGEFAGPVIGRDAQRTHLLDIQVNVFGGRLRTGFSYSVNVHRRETIEALANGYMEALRELIAHCRSEEAGGVTPSDFPLIHLDQPSLEALVGNGRGVEDLYPLAPIQQGMLFHALYEPEQGFYVGQLTSGFQGEMDTGAFGRAWNLLVARHTALRTTFRWQELEEPLQIVHLEAEVPFEVVDWRQHDEEEQRRLFARHLQEDRARGFDLEQPPLMRVLLIRTEDAHYRLVWSFHQILLDGWSLPILFEDFFALYEAERQGRTAQLPPAVPFRRYMTWLAARDRQAAETYWREALAGFEEPTPLAFDLPAEGPGSREGVHREEKRSLPAALTTSLEALARRQRLTLNTLVQSLWGLLLGRLAGQEDVVFGATVSGRPADLEGVENMVGAFINTLPVRIQAPAAAEVGPWLVEQQKRTAELQQFDYTALAEVQRWSQVPAGEGLFDSLMVFQNHPGNRQAAAGDEAAAAAEAGEGAAPSLAVGDISTEERANYSLALVVHPGENLTLELAFETDRFEVTSIRRWLLAMEELAAGLVTAKTLGELSLLPVSARHQLTVEWAAGPVLGGHLEAETPAFVPVDRQIARWAEERPGAVAVEWGEEKLSYAELETRVARLAAALGHRIEAPGTLVGLCLERSSDLVVATLAVLRAGGAFVPLDPAYPLERLRLLLSDSGLTSLVERRSALEVSGLSAEVEARDELSLLLLDELEEAPSIEAGSAMEAPAADPRQLAYLIYTSGTSGQPKAVMVEQGNLHHTLASAGEAFGFQPSDRMLYVAPYSFDISLFESLAVLLAGGTVRVLGRDDLLDMERLAAHVAETTVLHAVPSLMRQLVDHLRASSSAAGSKLRQAFVGGDRVPPDLLREMQRAFSEAQVDVLYGPTEATIICTSYRLERPWDGWRNLIGRALPG